MAGSPMPRKLPTFLRGSDVECRDDHNRRRVDRLLPPEWEGHPARSPSMHMKACCRCGKSKWKLGEMYYTDCVDATGADKLCECCIEKYAEEKGWQEVVDDKVCPPRIDSATQRHISKLLPYGWCGRMVIGDHYKACTKCRRKRWFPGTMYYTDHMHPLGADKLCEWCILPYAVEHWGPAVPKEGNIDTPEEGDAMCTTRAAQAPSFSYSHDCEGWPASPRQPPPQEAAHAQAKRAHAPVRKSCGGSEKIEVKMDIFQRISASCPRRTAIKREADTMDSAERDIKREKH